jgi:hypothetical protein
MTDDRAVLPFEEGNGRLTRRQWHGGQQSGAIERIGGTMPEDLPTPAESIQELQRREQKRLEAERQPSLFAEGEGEDDGNDES